MKLMMFNFRCESCNSVFEKLTKSSDVTVSCPTCGNTADKTVSAPIGIKFNGTGFYETDFKGKK